MICGNNGRRLFSFPHEYRRFLAEVAVALERDPCELHTAVLRSHHVQLIVTPTDPATIPRLVRTFSGRYAKRRNRRRDHTGKLFHPHYKCVPLLDDRQLALTTAFIELDPVRAGAVADAIDWRWSTSGLHAGEALKSGISPALWTPSPWYRRLGVAGYRDWLVACRRESLAPLHVEQILAIEAKSSPTEIRIRRPDETRAT
jgi:REP element-mobilizing transposase RayT